MNDGLRCLAQVERSTTPSLRRARPRSMRVMLAGASTTHQSKTSAEHLMRAGAERRLA